MKRMFLMFKEIAKKDEDMATKGEEIAKKDEKPS